MNVGNQGYEYSLGGMTKMIKNPKQKTHLALLLILMLFLSATLTGCILDPDAPGKARLKEHLEKKYGKEFIVDHSRYTGTKVRNTFVAHSVEENIYFEASMHNVGTKDQVIYDSYAYYQMWDEATNMWKDKLQTLMPYPVHLKSVSVGLKTEYSEWLDVAKKVEPQKYSLKYLLAHPNGEIDGFNYAFIIFVPKGTKDLTPIYEGMYHLVEDTRANKLNGTMFEVDVLYEEAKTDKELETLYKELANGGDVDDFLHKARDKGMKFAYGSGYAECKLVNSVEDLKKTIEFNILK